MKNNDLMADPQQRLRTGSGLPAAILFPSSLTESFEIVLGRAVDRNRAGDNICIIHCDGYIGGCVANPLGLHQVCMKCRQIRDDALDNHLADIPRFSLCEYRDKTNSTIVDERSRIEIEDGAQSTILTFFRIGVRRNSKQHGRRVHEFIFQHYVRYSSYVFCCLLRLFQEVPLERVEFFNGRIVPSKAVIAAARRAKISYSIIEVIGKNKSLEISDNESFHDLNFHKKRLAIFIENGQISEALGHHFFQLRRTGRSTDMPSFTLRQSQGRLPDTRGKTVVSVFLSSPDELRVNGEQWFTLLSLDPASFIADLRSALADDYDIIVRMHPNQHGDRTGESKQLMKSIGAIRGVRLIKPHDPGSTYELIDMSDFIVSFGSTVGLEAAYWGKPSILVGRAVWEDCGVSYNCDTLAEVKSIVEKRLPALDSSNAIKAGAFYMGAETINSALSYSDGRFYVNGRNYLAAKRARDPIGIFNRLFDAYLRSILLNSTLLGCRKFFSGKYFSP